MNRLSRIFCPSASTALKSKAISSSKNQTLLVDLGLMKPSDRGTFYYLPLLQRSLNKAVELINRFMHKLDAQQISIPNLTSVELWRESGRFDNYQSELFLTNDRHQKELLLGPTFEEAITKLMASGYDLSENQLPLRLYQIGNKFRDEQMPRYGLLRSREFIMKDLYTFDADKEKALQTYEEVSEVYSKFFRLVGVPFAKVEADAKEMGGCLSHEYHFLAPIGEEKLAICSKCKHATKTEAADTTCSKCNDTSPEQVHGIEIGHTFYLGDTYSKQHKATYLKAGKPTIMQMGCHGIGVTRLVGAAIESQSTDTHLRWPFVLAPFSVCIIPPEKRSKAFSLATHHLDAVYKSLNSINGLNDSVLVDDRIKLPIGERFRNARRLGIPLIVVIGKAACDADNVQFELHFTQADKTCNLSLSDLITEVTNFVKSNTDET